MHDSYTTPPLSSPIALNHALSMILTVLGHPSPGSLNEALAEAYTNGAQKAGVDAKLTKLQDLDFEPGLQLTNEVQPLESSIQTLQKDIEAASHVTWVFPVWWGTAPALFKGLIDRTFLPGWAFKNTGNGFPKRLLSGRSARTMITMDAPWWYYRWAYGRSAHRAFEHATLWYTGFSPILSTTYYDVRASTEKHRGKWIKQAEKLGQLDAKRRG